MRFQFPDIALLAAIVVTPLLCTGEVLDIPSDATIASLVASAKAARAQGHNADALAYFDAAVKRDSSDYMTLFQRGATYLSGAHRLPRHRIPRLANIASLNGP